MSLNRTYPSVAPSLNLNFIRSKRLDPRVTFTRASVATRVNALGLIETVGNDVPRFDYDPVTLAARGLLIEEARTNLLTYSGALDNAAWTKDNSSVTAGQTAPDGSASACVLAPTTVGTLVRAVRQAVSTSVQGTYTFSVYVKVGTLAANGIGLRVRDGTATNDFRGNFTIVGTSAAPATLGVLGSWVGVGASIVDVGNGWFRCTMTGTTNTAYTSLVPEIYLRTYAAHAETTGTVFLWGAQLEVGAFPTSYTPTTTATATRAADLCSMTGSNFSSWYRQDEGTMFGEYVSPITIGGCVFNTDDGTVGNRNLLNFDINGGGSRRTVVGGVEQVTGLAGSVTPGLVARSAYAYRLNDFAASMNGGAVATDTSGLVPPGQITARLGANVSFVSHINGHIRRIQYFPARLPNTQLQVLSAL